MGGEFPWDKKSLCHLLLKHNSALLLLTPTGNENETLNVGIECPFPESTDDSATSAIVKSVRYFLQTVGLELGSIS